ncbi:energy-coupling factor transporter ATP-binding protein EcfA2 [Lachnospiraceae bacterium PM6-15]
MDDFGEERVMDRKVMIEFENYTFKYFSQAEPTLHEINLQIYEGEKVLIVGPSGSGKSTLGHCLNGLIPSSYKGETTGTLRIEGKDVLDQSIFERSGQVGTVLQDADGQFVGLSVGEDIAFSLENDGTDQVRMKELVDQVSALVDMDQHLKSSPFELSGGQKQRVSFAGIMVNDVPIMLFDEPLANLDPATGKTAIDLIDQIHQQFHKTMVIIEHRLEDVLYRHVDRIIVIEEGRIVAEGTPDALLAGAVLSRCGIREPLYVTAIKYAGVAPDESLRLGSIETLNIDQVKAPLLAWEKAQRKSPEKAEKEEILRISNLEFSYTKKRQILKGIDISIKAGEMVSIVGRNGAGKSTLAKVICGFVKEDAGDVFYKGQSLKGQTIKERSQIIGYVMQNPNQMICKPMIYDEIALGLRLRDVPEEEIEPRVEKVMKICGLTPFRKWPVSALSYGQKKRVTIASILVLNPHVLILDEPTSGQDYKHYTEIMEFLKELNDQGVTIILITHDMHLMLEYTPHAIVLSEGEKLGDASAAEILSNPEVAAAANLKVTSLYDLAQKIGLPEPSKFVQQFIDSEKEVR